MGILHKFLVLQLTCIVYINAGASKIEDYSWRDYENKIPFDALPGGVDGNGTQTYIGQVVFENSLLPGRISANDRNVYFEWNGREVAKFRNVKILCSSDPSNFEWFQTDNNTLWNTPERNLLIKGGFQSSGDTFIGRVAHDGEVLIGKVVCNVAECLGLHVATSKGTRLHKSFQVLRYID